VSFFKWLLAVWHDFHLQDGCSCNICCVLVFFQASLSGECETMIWEVHYYQQIAGLFDGENLQQHHRSASTSTYTNWSLAYISSCIPHRKCKEMNELVFYSPLTSFFGIDHGLQYFRVALGCMAWFSASRWTLFKRGCLWAWEHDIGWALKSDCRDFDEEK